MKLPIKFRGGFWNKDGLDSYDMPDYKDGDIIYGGYARMKLLTSVGEGDYIIDNRGGALLVYPDSVAMFLGYDKNGKEIYSDDKIRVKDWNRYCLAGTGIEDAADFFKISDIGKTFDNVELLKESGNDDN